MTLEQLNQRWAIPNLVRFDAGGGNLPRMILSTADAEAHVYLHGAHVSHYQHRGEKPILWMSAKSWYEPGKPIRGGVPVIFPWFGPRAGHPESPNHGFARLRSWKIVAIEPGQNGSVTATLALRSDEQTRAAWPHDFDLHFSLTVGRSLQMALEVRNTGREAFTFDEALHTYFTVGDIRRASVHGLAGASFLGKAEGNARATQGSEPITFTGETDRIYFNTRAACTLEDPVLGRRIVVAKSGSEATVVWNPWITKAKAMPDFGDDEWPGMVCVETVNAMDNAVRLEAGQSHVMTAEIQ